MMVYMNLRGVKILLKPTKEQEQKFFDSAFYADLMFNTALQWNIDYYNSEGKFYSYFDMLNKLPAFKKENPDFSIPSVIALQGACKDVRNALDRMKSGNRFPRFKKAGKYLSFLVQNGNFPYIRANYVELPKMGKVKCKHCHWLTKDKTECQYIRMKTYNSRVKYDGKYWFLIFAIEVDITADNTTNEVVGLDLGIEKTITTSSGVVYSNINKTRKVLILQRRKKRLQRKIARKYELNKEGKRFIKTKNIKRLEKQVRLIDRKLSNIRENYNQSIVNDIISKYPKRIMIEDLNVKGMMKNRHLARAIQEQQFYRIRQLLTEKALNTINIQIGVVNRFYPSSKLCHTCDFKNKYLKVSDRIFRCPNCGSVIDRDYNAALNLRDCDDYKLAF